MIKTVFLDMDGVLTDFRKGIYNTPNWHRNYSTLTVTWKFWEDFNIPFEVINEACDIDFWANLEWTYNGKEIFSKVIETFGINNIYLLTVPMPNPGSGTGKILWVEKNIPTLIKQLIITQASKSLLANLDTLLIDDRDENVVEFRKAGGQAILVPQPWNSLYNQADKSLEIVKQSLEKICRES